MRTFSDLAALSAWLANASRRMREAAGHGLELGAQVIETEAKAELGNYQAATGQFEAWPELADSTKADRVAKGFTENDPGLRSGAMRESIKHTAKMEAPMKGRAVIGSDDLHLLWFEQGTTRQPPRPVLALAAFRRGKQAANLIGESVFAVIAGRPPPRRPTD